MPRTHKEYSNLLELLNQWVDEATLVFSVQGSTQDDEHQHYWQKWKVFLRHMQRWLRASGEAQLNLTVLPSLLSIVTRERNFDNYLPAMAEEAKILRNETDTLKSSLPSAQLDAMNHHLDELCRISAWDPKLMARNIARHEAFNKQLEVLGSKLSMLATSPQSLRIFISYSRMSETNIDRVRCLATHLITAGFDVKLDIIHNKHGFVSAFLDHIDSDTMVDKRPTKADVILVMCTPGVPDGISSARHNDTLREELRRIQYRNMHEPAETNRIFPVILSGSYLESVPVFLQQRATDALNMSNSMTRVRAFFNLIQAIYLNDAEVVELTNSAYHAYSVQVGYQHPESPELEESLPDMSHIAETSSSQQSPPFSSGFFHHSKPTSTILLSSALPYPQKPGRFN